MKLHGMPLCVSFAVGGADITEAACARSAIVNPGIPDKADSRAGEENAAEIFPIIVAQQLCIPGTCGLGQFTAHQPGGGLHMEIKSQFAEQPFRRRQICPECSGSKTRPGMPVKKTAPA